MLAVIYSFGAGLLGAACALAIFILWRDHQRVTAMWAFLAQQQNRMPAPITAEANPKKGGTDK